MIPKKDTSFRAVALFVILMGAAIFGYGLFALIGNLLGYCDVFFPFAKVIGGLVVIALGYIHLNLELMRQK
ncbi:MAG TPA: hypothetical protein PK263_00630 [bacterium]|nr:hypothetical protein [bacterium]